MTHFFWALCIVLLDLHVKKASRSYFLWLWHRDPVLEQVLGQRRAEMI